MAERMVQTEVFLEAGRISSDEKPLRYVGLQYRRDRVGKGFVNVYGPLIVIVVVSLSTWAFVALSGWSS